MKIKSEIEAKLRCRDHGAVAAALSAAGGRFIRNVLQRDSYYDDKAGGLYDAGAALRVREESSPQGYSSASITYKGLLAGGAFKSRPEVNVEAGSAADAALLLEALGYNRHMLIEKRRAVWQVENCDVALDELPLIGRFVEIEGPDEVAVEAVQRKLGLGELEHIRKSYASLVLDEIKRRGLSCEAATFERGDGRD